jgi:hypothetical protein
MTLKIQLLMRSHENSSQIWTNISYADTKANLNFVCVLCSIMKYTTTALFLFVYFTVGKLIHIILPSCHAATAMMLWNHEYNGICSNCKTNREIIFLVHINQDRTDVEVQTFKKHRNNMKTTTTTGNNKYGRLCLEVYLQASPCHSLKLKER